MSMGPRSVAFVVLLLLVSTVSQARMILGKGAAISFASVAEGEQLLTSHDDFVGQMSPFDRAARLKTDKDVSERQYLKFVGRNVLEWSHADKQKINSAFAGIQKMLEVMALPFPKKVLIIKTTGKEEGGSPYTRANAIVMPQSYLKESAAEIQKTICHELFHILSRANPDLREKLYAAIGFVKCREVAFPAELKSRKITNSDAPRNDHCIRLKFAGNEQWGIPILFSSAEKYDVERGGEFFNYLQFRFLLVEQASDGSTVRPIAKDHKPKLVGIDQVSGFFDQVGKNTDYIIHPEEILADNFALLVVGRHNLPSPEIIEKIRKILKGRDIAGQGAAGGAGRPRH